VSRDGCCGGDVVRLVVGLSRVGSVVALGLAGLAGLPGEAQGRGEGKGTPEHEGGGEAGLWGGACGEPDRCGDDGGCEQAEHAGTGDTFEHGLQVWLYFVIRAREGS